MGTLTIRKLDDGTIARLKARARLRGRSLEADLRELLVQSSRQPLILDALAEADRIAAMTPRDVPQTDSLVAAAGGRRAMIVVVEPGVAIKWFVEEPLRPQARSLLVDGHELIAPDILIAGVAELAWKKAASGEIAPDQAAPIVRSIGLPSFISAFVESTRLRNRALALALQCGRPVHECFYAACAEAASATLVSSDETFLQALQCRRHRHPRRAAGAHPRACRRVSPCTPSCRSRPTTASCAAARIRASWRCRRSKLGHTAIGIADRNTLAGVVRAYAAIKEYYEEYPAPEEKRFKLLVGARLETRDGYSLHRLSHRPRSLQAALPPADGRQPPGGQGRMRPHLRRPRCPCRGHPGHRPAAAPARGSRLPRAPARPRPPVRRSLLPCRHHAVPRRRCAPPGAARQSRRRRWAWAWSPPTTCTITCPSGGRCTTW